MTHYPAMLKEWRKRRRLSQLDLALDAEVSARHISFLETGRARPSRDMILHLSEVMNVPIEARNLMMQAVGFTPHYATTPFDNAMMAPIRDAVTWTLDRHAPYPGMALDRVWRIVQLNAPAAQLFAPLGLGQGASLLDFLSNPIIPNVIENWPEVAHYTMLRLRAESAKAGGIAELEAAITMLTPHAAPLRDDTPPPAIPTIYRMGDQRLSLFGTIAQFSTVSDETLDDLKVELFFPADAQSTEFLTALAR